MRGSSSVATFEQNNAGAELDVVPFAVTISGGGQVWRYTNADTPFTDAEGNGYEPVPMKVGKMESDAAMGGGELDVTLPKAVSLAVRFIPFPTRTVYHVLVRKLTLSGDEATDFRTYFTGTIKDAPSSGEAGELMVLKCTTQMYKMGRNALWRRYQHHCPLVLYGPLCRASKAKSALPATIRVSELQSQGTVILTFSPDSDEDIHIHTVRGMDIVTPAGREFLKGSTFAFRGTEYEATDIIHLGGLAFIFQVRQDVRESLMSAVAATPAAERACTVYPGCDHTLNICTKIHRNTPNYGGMPWIPHKNPVGTSFVG